MKNTNEEFEWKGMLVLSVLMIIGILIIYFSWGGMSFTYDNFQSFLFKHGIEFIFSLFFIGVGIFVWVAYFNNIIRKPKKEVVYLKKFEYSMNVFPILTFVDKKGKIILKEIKTDMFANKSIPEYEEKKYYEVLKTKNIIQKIIGITSKEFPLVKEKKSFWLNWYSPISNFENIFLLPIMYVIFLQGLLSFLISKGAMKIVGLVWCISTGYCIIYDIIKKIKNK